MKGQIFMKNELGKALKTVPELYHDTLQPSAQETGKMLARIPRAINAAFSGLDKWILNREYSVDETKNYLLKNSIKSTLIKSLSQNHTLQFPQYKLFPML